MAAMAALPDRRTERRRSGDRAEALVRRYLRSLGWTLLAHNVAIARDELDVVAVDLGPPQMLVFVEVRSNVSGRFGAPEEFLAGGKLARTYRAALAVLRAGGVPGGSRLPRLPWRIDVVVV